MYLTEHRNTHHELVIKAINSKNMSVEEFLREFHHSMILGSHRNILTVFPDMVYQLEGQCCMFATEYAPLGDLTSNINDQGIGKNIHWAQASSMIPTFCCNDHSNETQEWC